MSHSSPRPPERSAGSHSNKAVETSPAAEATENQPAVVPSETAKRTVARPAGGPADAVHRIGDYLVVKKVGEGGMGAVYLAEDPRLHRKVAVKTMRPELAARPDSRERFVREARAAAAVEHDHIVPILHIGECSDGTPYIVMPFLQGESLDERLARTPVVPLGLLLKVAREVADGLAAAHAKGLTHRDIKPANIWLEGDLTSKDGAQHVRRCKILDFGLARAEEDHGLTADGAILGTPAYMAPEQARGSGVDHRADLYSLGATLYRMATGELPFTAPNKMALLYALVHEPPRPVRDLNPAVPVEVARLIDQLLSKQPADRPPAVAAAARRIEAALEARPVPPPPPAWELVADPGVPLDPAPMELPDEPTEPAARVLRARSAPAHSPAQVKARPRSVPTRPQDAEDEPQGRRWLPAAVAGLLVLAFAVLVPALRLATREREREAASAAPAWGARPDVPPVDPPSREQSAPSGAKGGGPPAAGPGAAPGGPVAGPSPGPGGPPGPGGFVTPLAPSPGPSSPPSSGGPAPGVSGPGGPGPGGPPGFGGFVTPSAPSPGPGTPGPVPGAPGPQPGPGPMPGAGGPSIANTDGNRKARIDNFYAAAFDTERKEMYTIDERREGAARKGWLRRYSYPDFKLLGRYPLPHLATRAAVDPKGGLLYLATVITPAAQLNLLDRVSATGEVAVYDLKAVQDGKANDAELKPAATLSVKAEICGLELSDNGKSLYVLTTSGPPRKSALVVFDAETRREAAKRALPERARDMARAVDGKGFYIIEDYSPRSKTASVGLFDIGSMTLQSPVVFPGAVADVAPRKGGGAVVTVLPVGQPTGGAGGPGASPPGVGGPGEPAGPPANRFDFRLYLLNANGQQEMDLGALPRASNAGYVRYDPDNKKLFVTSYQGPPGAPAPGLDVFDVTDATAATGLKLTASIRTAGREPIGGHCLVTPDGKALVFHNGLVLDTANIGGAPAPPLGLKGP